MVFEAIDRLKQHWTDKWVMVDDSMPELKRFAGCPGVVKTVNMNGRALVQFDQYDNIGWYDVDPVYLRIVDPPSPAEKAAKSAAAKPEKVAPAKAKPVDKAQPATGAAKPSAMNVADILAAARGGAAPAKAEPAPAPAKVETPSAPAKPASPAGMSVADILAAARGQSGPAKAESPPADVATTEAAPAEIAEATPVEEAPAPIPAPAAKGKLPTDVAGIIAYCREHDARS